MTTPDNLTPQKTCTKCGITKPATIEYFHTQKRGKFGFRSICRECNHLYDISPEVRERKRRQQSTPEYRAKDREIHKTESYKRKKKIRRSSPEYREREREYRSRPEVRERMRKKRQSSEYQKTVKDWYVRNKERLIAYRRDYQVANRERLNLYGHIKRARKRRLPHTFTEKDRQRMLDYWGHCCCICGRPAGLWHVLANEHWQPESKGGSFTPDNILPMCHAMKDGENCCNNSKYNNDPIEWLVKTFGKRKAKTKLSEIERYFDWIKGLAES